MVQLETILETDRLRLEPIRSTHAPELFELLSDERLYLFIPQDPPTLASLEERFRRLESRRSSDGEELWLNWVLRWKEIGRCIGRVQATILPDATAFLAYDLGVEYWGRGLATEACRRVIEALFSDFAVSRILAEVDTRNLASMRLLDRLGFERGALKKDADSFKGSSSDEYTYVLGRAAPSP
jgi:RimJ/RimL family protein N-acetyltransferase